jgi:hypothetical protein
VRPKLQQKKQEIALTAVERYNRVVAAAELDAIRIVTAEFNAAPSAHQTLAGSEGETAIAHVIHHVHDFTLDPAAYLFSSEFHAMSPKKTI